MVPVFDIGDVVPLTVEIRDANGALANATTVTLTITLPDGTSITPAVASPSTGRYQLDYQTVQVGRHSVRWVATGSNASAHTDAFDVQAADPGGILSLSAAKRALNIPTTSTDDDDDIRSLVAAVTSVIEDEYLKESVVRRTVSERVEAQSSRRVVLGKHPIISVTSVQCGGYTWPSADIEVDDPATGEIVTNGAAFSGDLDVVYVAGRAAIPQNYAEAAKIILKHLWQTQQAPGLGSRVFGGGEDISVGIAGLGFAIPNRAAELLGGRGVVVL